jgi:hypothetical protein
MTVTDSPKALVAGDNTVETSGAIGDFTVEITGGTTYDFSTDSVAYRERILSIDHHEEYMNDYAYVVLNNPTGAIPDLTGYWTDIGYGLTTGSGKEHCHTARLWVKQQLDYHTRSGEEVTVLKLEGMWSRLRETYITNTGLPPYFYTEWTNTTIYDLIELFVGRECQFSLAALVEDDGIIDTIKPKFRVNNSPYETAAIIIRALLELTYCYLRSKPGLELEVVNPGGDSTPDVTYYRDTTPQYYSFTDGGKRLNLPNRAVIIANYDYTEGAVNPWSNPIYGTYEDTVERNKYEDIIYIAQARSITVQGDADDRAQIALTKVRDLAQIGRVVVPHDSRIELFDMVKIDISVGGGG